MANLIDTIVDGPISHTEGTATKTGNSGLTLDLSTGTSFEVNMDAYTTHNLDSIVVNGATGSSLFKSFLLQVTQHTQNRNFTWSSINNVKWPSGTGPTLTTTNDKKDIYSFTTWDNGTTWYGKVIGQNY